MHRTPPTRAWMMCLLLASGAKPSLIIDYATLTGSCINSLGKAYSGVFSNREALLPVLTAAGRAWLEQSWPQLEPEARIIFRRKFIELNE